MMNNILVVMGSESDMSAMKPAVDVLRKLGVGVRVTIASAHRTPQRAAELAKQARHEKVGALIAGAGLAHHLAGALAARTTLPVIAVPLSTGSLSGMDSLLSAVQMPPGVPVAVVGVGAARNAGLLAAQILSVSDKDLAQRLEDARVDQARKVDEANTRVQSEFCDGN